MNCFFCHAEAQQCIFETNACEASVTLSPGAPGQSILGEEITNELD